MKPHWSVLPIIIVGVAIGTLIALYVSYLVAQKQIQANGTQNALLNAAINNL